MGIRRAVLNEPLLTDALPLSLALRPRRAHACRAPLLRERASRGHLPCPMRAGSVVSVSAQVKACELDAVIVAGNRFEDACRDRRLQICFGVRADWWDSLAPTSEGCVGACDGLAPMSWASWLQERFESLLGACGLLPYCYARRDSNAPSMRAWPAEPIAQARAASSFKVSVPGWRSTWAYSDIGKSIAFAHCCAVSPDISRARVSQFFTLPPFPWIWRY